MSLKPIYVTKSVTINYLPSDFIGAFYFIILFHRCCRVCAKTLGEACGGPNGFSGTCEPPLECISKPLPDRTGICIGKLLIFFLLSKSLIKFCVKVFKPIQKPQRKFNSVWNNV